MQLFAKWLNLILLGMGAMLVATECQALPAFARQAGVPCSVCHQQHFPVLNSFGRAFKASGYTLSTSGMVEGDRLSIPATLNAALFVNAQYIETNGLNQENNLPQSMPRRTFDAPINAMSLFLGGRIAENVGFITEVPFSPSPGGTVAAFKMPFIYDVKGNKVGAVPFSTDGLGVSHSFELMNTGAVAVHEFNQADLAAISAQAYINTTGSNPTILNTCAPNPNLNLKTGNTRGCGPAAQSSSAANGLALVATNADIGFITYAKFSPAHLNGGSNGNPTSNYLRVAATPANLVPGWDIGFGAQYWDGDSYLPLSAVTAADPLPNPLPPVQVDTRAMAVDFQALGTVSDKPLTLIASYGRAPASTYSNNADDGTLVGVSNLFNQGSQPRISFNVGVELGVIPEVATVQVGLRRAKSGFNEVGDTGNVITGTNATDNAVMVGANYKLAQNVKFGLTYSRYSGSLYNSSAATNPDSIMAVSGNWMTVLQLEAAF